MRHSVRLLRPAVLAGLVAAAVVTAVGAPVSAPIPFTTHGDVLDGATGSVVPLTSSSFLVACTGPDGAAGTADDRVLLATGADGVPVLTPLTVPYLPSPRGGVERLSASRAVVAAAGGDGTWGTADDAVVILGSLGSANTATPLAVGFLSGQEESTPVRLTADTAVVAGAGIDGIAGTADDVVVLLRGLGGLPTATPLPAPFLPSGPRSRPVALRPDAFLLASDGPDGAAASADDVVYCFLDVGGANTRTSLATPRLFSLDPGRPVRLSASRALVASAGADATDGTADDMLVLLDKLGTADKVTLFSAPAMAIGASGRATAMTESSVVVVSLGGDGTALTADDALHFVDKLGSQNDVQPIPLAYLSPAALRLGPASCLLLTGGVDGTLETADDQAVVLTDLGVSNTAAPAPVPGLSGMPAGRPVALSATAALFSAGGPTGTLGAGGDDQLVLLSGLPDAPSSTPVPLTGNAVGGAAEGYVPAVLGAGRAAVLSTGGDSAPGGGDDGVQVVSGIDGLPGLVLLKAKLKFIAEIPEKGEKAAVKGTLLLADPARFGSGDLTVTIGNASQTLPQKSVVEKKPGLFVYADPKGLEGFVRKVVYKASKGKLTLKAKGLGTGIETTSPGYVLVSLDGGDFSFGDAPAGIPTAKGITYKRPKE